MTDLYFEVRWALRGMTDLDWWIIAWTLISFVSSYAARIEPWAAVVFLTSIFVAPTTWLLNVAYDHLVGALIHD